MSSIVEVEISVISPFSNWPDFDQKWSKIGHFWPKMAQNEGLSNFLLKIGFKNTYFQVFLGFPAH